MRHAWTLAALAASGLLAAGAAAPAAVAADNCPNAKVRAQQGVSHLPNCLAYERLTPNNKNGTIVAAEYVLNDDGTEALVYANAPITEGAVSGNAQTLLASRGPDGWGLEPLTNTPVYSGLRNTGPGDYLHMLGVEGTRRLLFQSTAPFVAEDVAGGEAMATGDMYLREPDGTFRWLTKPEGFTYAMHQPAGGPLDYVRGTPDLSAAVFGLDRVLVPAIDSVERKHYWLWRDGKPFELLDRMADGSPSQLTTLRADKQWMTPDFKVFVWETMVGSGRNQVRQLYARVDPGTPQARTVKVTESTDGTKECTATGTSGMELGYVTLDARYVAFRCASQLTDDAPTAGGQYVKDLQTGTLHYDSPSRDYGPTTIDEASSAWTRPDGTYRLERRADNNLWTVDLRTGEESCATCTAWVGGTAPLASFQGGVLDGAAGGLGLSNRNYVTPKGDVYFVSSRRLVPEDRNDFLDLYLSTGGTVHLVSGGDAPQDIRMGGVSLDGSSASFATSSSLVAEDQDGGVRDVYVLRENGGYFREAKAAECAAGCQGPSVPANPLAPPLSLSFPETGDVADDGADPIAVSGSRVVRGTSLKLKVAVPAKGRVSVSGSGLGATAKSVGKASTVTLNVRLSARSQRTLRRKGSVKVKATVRYVPADGSRQSKRVNLTFRKKTAKKAAKKGSSRGVAVASYGKAAR